jgi:excisionase family DNA binding protein
LRTNLIELNNIIQDYMKQNNINTLDSNEILRILRKKKILNNYQTLYQYFRRKALFGLEFKNDGIYVNRIEDYEKCYSVNEISNIMEISKSIIYTMIEINKIRVKRIGDMILIPESELNKINIWKESKNKEFKNKEVPQWD